MIVQKTALGLKSHIINKISVNPSTLNIYFVFSFSEGDYLSFPPKQDLLELIW